MYLLLRELEAPFLMFLHRTLGIVIYPKFHQHIVISFGFRHKLQSFVINSHSFYFSSLSLNPVMAIFLFSILAVLTLLPNLVWSFGWLMSMLVDAECLYMLHNLLIRFELLHGIQLPKSNNASNGIC